MRTGFIGGLAIALALSVACGGSGNGPAEDMFDDDSNGLGGGQRVNNPDIEDPGSATDAGAPSGMGEGTGGAGGRGGAQVVQDGGAQADGGTGGDGGAGGGQAGGAGGGGGGGQAGGAGGGGSPGDPGQCKRGGLCAELKANYDKALPKALACTVGAARHCRVKASSSLVCGCPLWVNNASALNDIAKEWEEADCAKCGATKQVKCLLCQALPASGTCQELKIVAPPGGVIIQPVTIAEQPELVVDPGLVRPPIAKPGQCK